MVKKREERFSYFLYNLFKPYLPKLILVIVLIIAYSVGVVYFPKMFGTLIKMFENFTPGNFSLPPTFYNQIIELAVMLVIVYVIKMIISYLIFPISEDVTQNIREMLHNKIRTIDIAYLSSNNSGDILGRMNHDTLNIRNLIGEYLYFIVSKSLLMIFSLVMMFLTNVKLAAIYFVILIVYVFILYFLCIKTVNHYKESEKQFGRMLALIGDTILNKTMLNVFNTHKYNKERFSEVILEEKESYKNSTFISMAVVPLSQLISNLGYILIYLQATYLLITKQINMDVLLVFILYGQIFISQVRYIGKALRVLEVAYASFTRIYEIMKIPDVGEYTENIRKIEGDIEFRNVNFAYENEKTVLDNCNFKIDKNKINLIKGGVSSGKTTIIRLITKFYRVNSGEILIDGINIDQIPQGQIVSEFTLITEGNYLFKGTVEENIAYAADDISKDKLIKAAKEVGSHEFIMNMPDQYDTVISEEEDNISQGERQLILLTRAYLKDSNVLIIDNPTLNIDIVTRQKVKKALNNLMKDKTTIIFSEDLDIEYDKIIRI
ncbi:MAG: ABC transporter ATP-binding protein [Methanosphaera sp.]|nr:ABC transporter ATP-binding protein [Methanosphaera sp.]